MVIYSYNTGTQDTGARIAPKFKANLFYIGSAMPTRAI